MRHEPTRAYYNGLREGLERYAHWKDGVQFVGSCGTTLTAAIRATRVEEARKIAELDFAHPGAFEESSPDGTRA